MTRSRDIISALLLQRNAYERIAQDPTGTLRASAIVLFVALVHGASAFLRAHAFGWPPFVAPLFGLSGEVAFWMGAGLGSAAVCRWCFSVSAPLSVYYRALGLAAAPGIFIAVPALASVFAPGTERIGLPLVALYRGAALLVALRSVGNLSWTQGIFASLAGVLSGFTAVAAITLTLSARFPG